MLNEIHKYINHILNTDIQHFTDTQNKANISNCNLTTLF